MHICKMCNESKEKLIRCHIYPESMSREISGQEHLLVSASMDGEKSMAGYAYGGIYDKEIICASCESIFKEADEYAIDFRRKVLRLEMPASLPLKTAKLPSFPANAEKLHKFAMQTWLRSHFSQRHENHQINDSKKAGLISRTLLDRRETIETGTEICFLFFTCDISQLMMSPVYHKLPDHPLYSLWMPNMNILIAASESGLPPAFSNIRLERGKPVTVLRSRRLFEPTLNTIIDGVLPHYEKMSFLFNRRKNSK
ncbi:MAG: hypothetical protein IT473_07410 [Lysobacter sp.]|nr:hypothetical protein [Lysobacter sp.]